MSINDFEDQDVEEKTPEHYGKPIDIPSVSVEEFIELANYNKVKLLDALGGQMLKCGYESAMADAEYYRVKLAAGDKSRLPELTARRAQLNGEYDALKHAVSALQSTLRIERMV